MDGLGDLEGAVDVLDQRMAQSRLGALAREIDEAERAIHFDLQAAAHLLRRRLLDAGQRSAPSCTCCQEKNAPSPSVNNRTMTSVPIR